MYKIKIFIVICLILFVAIVSFAEQPFGNSVVNRASVNMVYDLWDYYQIVPYYGNILKDNTFVISMDDAFAGDALSLGFSFGMDLVTPIILLQYDANGTASSETYNETEINGQHSNSPLIVTDPNKTSTDSYKIGVGLGKMIEGNVIGAYYTLSVNNNITEVKTEDTRTTTATGAVLYKESYSFSNTLTDLSSVSHTLTVGTKIGFILPQLQVKLSSEKGDNTKNYSKIISETYSIPPLANYIQTRSTVENKGIDGSSGSTLNGRNLKNSSVYLEGMVKLGLIEAMGMEPEIIVGYTKRSLDSNNAIYETSSLTENYDAGTQRFDSSTKIIDTYTYRIDSDSTLSMQGRIREYLNITDNLQIILGPSYALSIDSYKYFVEHKNSKETKQDNNNDGDYTDAGDTWTLLEQSGDNDWRKNSNTIHTISLPLCLVIKPSPSLNLFIGSSLDYSIILSKEEYEDIKSFTNREETNKNTGVVTPTPLPTYSATDSKETITTSLSKSVKAGFSWEFAKNYSLNGQALALAGAPDTVATVSWMLSINGRF